MTSTPIPYVTKYGVVWRLTKGFPIGPTGEKLSRNEFGFPIIEIEDEYGRPGEEFEETIVSHFHTEYEWNSVDLSYNISEPESEALINFNIRADMFAYHEEVTVDPLTGVTETVIVIEPEVPKFDIWQMTIYSEDPNSGGTWTFPDDYDQIVDPNHPKQYGGVIMRNNDYSISTVTSCGIEDGPRDDGYVYWDDTQGRQQRTFSAYNYTDVFDQADFEYIPFNSNDAQQIDANDKFRFTPKYPDVEDRKGKAAPIYPMNMVTSFLPDTRESVDVIYRVNFTAHNRKTGLRYVITNANVSIKQTCFQDSSDYGEQLDQLLLQCNWANPGDIDDEDFSENYPYDYPFTFVNGFEGLGIDETPSKRPDDTLLARGDVWYNPSKDERRYYHVGDEPSKLEVKRGGKGYKSKRSVPCVWQYPEVRKKNVNGVEVTLPPKCYDVSERGAIPHGLLVDTEVKDGKIVSATVSEDATPQNFMEGDLVTITGGNGQATLEVIITEKSQWKLKYTEKDESVRKELNT